MLLFALLIFTLLQGWIVPEFKIMFEHLGMVNLPASTDAMLALAEMMSFLWPLSLMACAALGWSIVVQFRGPPTPREKKDILVLGSAVLLLGFTVFNVLAVFLPLVRVRL